jgi:hypothetical protein
MTGPGRESPLQCWRRFSAPPRVALGIEPEMLGGLVTARRSNAAPVDLTKAQHRLVARCDRIHASHGRACRV